MNLLEMFKQLTEEEKEKLANLILLSATSNDDEGNKIRIFEKTKKEN